MCKAEMLRLPSYSYAFCAIPCESCIHCKGYILCPMLADNRTIILLKEYSPTASPLVEMECISKSNKHRVGSYHYNKNQINNSALIGYAKCIACSKDRSSFGNRKHLLPVQLT